MGVIQIYSQEQNVKCRGQLIDCRTEQERKGMEGEYVRGRDGRYLIEGVEGGAGWEWET